MMLTSSERVTLIQKTLETLIPPSSDTPHSRLFQAARYSLFAKSKLLRPQLLIITAEELGANRTNALVPACALELIHTYSLIHDDLPCMDDDDFRRGKPSLHITFGEGDAVLVGDYLLTRAFQALAEAPYLTDHQKIRLIHTLSVQAGSEGMIGGQVADLALSAEIDWEHLEWVHKKKTGALFAAALECGGIVADAPESTLSKLKQAGFAFGIAFQILDDLADDTSVDSPLIPSAVVTLGKERAFSYAHELIEEAKGLVNDLSSHSGELASFMNALLCS